MQLCHILVLVDVAQLQLEVPEPAFHEAVLTGTGPLAAAERNLHPAAQLLMLVA